MTMTKKVVKYPNELNLNQLGFLSPVSQDIFINILAEFTSTQSRKIIISLKDLKSQSRLANETNTFFRRKLVEVNEELIRKLVFSMPLTPVSNPDWEEKYYTAPLFMNFTVDGDSLHTEIDPILAEPLYKIKGAFTKFSTDKFISARGKYTKALFRLFAKNHKGHCNVPIDELKDWLCVAQSYSTTNLKKVLQKAVSELEEKGIMKSATFEFIYGHGQGRPLKSVYFEYALNDKKIAELGGQTTILDYDFSTTEKTIEQVDLSDPLRPRMSKVTVVEPYKCPYCDSEVIERVATGHGENLGRRYRKCIKNDKSNQQCKYFEWIDPPISQNE